LIAPASAVSNTFDKIGTVVCALTILLAAPTADAMSLVLQVNFTRRPPFRRFGDASLLET
jgi:hypothetical protein